MSLQAAEPLHLKEAMVTCIPRLGGGVRRPRRGGSAAAAATQVSVLDRVRDVVLRLAMLSAASTATSSSKGAQRRRTGTATKSSSSPPRTAAARVSPASVAAYADSYRSEAVDECIEFLKRSAAGNGGAAKPPPASPLHTAACE